MSTKPAIVFHNRNLTDQRAAITLKIVIGEIAKWADYTTGPDFDQFGRINESILVDIRLRTHDDPGLLATLPRAEQRNISIQHRSRADRDIPWISRNVNTAEPALTVDANTAGPEHQRLKTGTQGDPDPDHQLHVPRTALSQPFSLDFANTTVQNSRWRAEGNWKGFYKTGEREHAREGFARHNCHCRPLLGK